MSKLFSISFVFRRVKRSKMFSLINILGLSVGMAVSLFVGFYVIEELSYDKFHEDLDRIGKLGMEGSLNISMVYNPVAENLSLEYDEVLYSSRFHSTNQSSIEEFGSKTLVEHGTNKFYEYRVAYADPDFLEIFSFLPSSQKAENPLAVPTNVIITQSIKQKYFGTSVAEGKSLRIAGSEYIVALVIDDLPANSTVQFSILLPIKDSNFEWYMPTQGYFKLNDGVDWRKFSEKLNNEKISRFGISPKLDDSYHITSMPFGDVHLKESSNTTRANIYYVKVFLIIGVVVLLIACVNYINLSTAQTLKRAKEVGIRKTLGASKNDIVLGFLFETFIYCMVSGTLAFAIVERLSRYFEDATSRDLIPSDNLYLIFVILIALTLVVSFLSGYIPSVWYGRIIPTKNIRSGAIKSVKGLKARSVLLGFQYVISITLILMTMVVYSQLNYLKNSDRGFQKSSKLVVAIRESLGNEKDVLANEIMKVSGVNSMSYTQWVPGRYYTTSLYGNQVESYVGDPDDRIVCSYGVFDDHFLKTLGLQMERGEWFRPSTLSENKEVIINQAASALIGKDNPIGAQIIDGTDTLKVIGVINDLMTESFKVEIRPAIYRYQSEADWRYILLDIDDKGLEATVKSIENIWQNIIEEYPLDSYIIEDYLEAQHRAESGLNKLLMSFAAIAVIICLLGLLGLSAYMQENRQKEFSIHKVLGAGISSLIRMSFSNYIKVILISLLIAVPLAYYAGNSWLETFVYQFDFRIQEFIWPILVLGLLSFSVSMIYIWRLLMVNPVDSLRSE